MPGSNLAASTRRLPAKRCSMTRPVACDFKAGSLLPAATPAITPGAQLCKNYCGMVIQTKSKPRSLGALFLRPNARKQTCYANLEFRPNEFDRRERTDNRAL